MGSFVSAEYCIPVDAVDDGVVKRPLREHNDNEQKSDSNTEVVQLTKETPQQTIDEVIEMIAVSFAGSKASAPEGVTSWVQDPKASGDDPSSPLLDDPSEERLDFCRFIAKMGMRQCLPQRSCFALINDGKVVSAALSLPPSQKNLSKMNPICGFFLALSTGVPEVMKSRKGPLTDRLDVVVQEIERAHSEHVSSPTWYVKIFATDAAAQGKGFGRKMMEFLTDLADQGGHPMYLETYGPRNERFYSRNGYEVKERIALRTEHDALEKHGGMLAMWRPPKSE